jgi:hypothetical protein
MRLSEKSETGVRGAVSMYRVHDTRKQHRKLEKQSQSFTNIYYLLIQEAPSVILKGAGHIISQHNMYIETNQR